MSASEVMAGFQWLYSVLMADSMLAGYAPGGLWRSMAPPGTATPYMMMAFQGGTDSTTLNGYRELVDALYQVKAVGPASISAQIANAAARLDALIGSPPTKGSVPGAYISASYRDSPLQMDELVAGELWTNIGGLYRLEIQSTG